MCARANLMSAKMRFMNHIHDVIFDKPQIVEEVSIKTQNLSTPINSEKTKVLNKVLVSNVI